MINKLKSYGFLLAVLLLPFAATAQRVDPDIQRLVAIQNDTAEYQFTSYQVPTITGPSTQLGSGRLEMGWLGGNEYVLRFISTSTISTEGWSSDIKLFPYDGDNTHTIQRVKMITQESIVSTHRDHVRVPLGTSDVDIPILDNDFSTNDDLLVDKITIVNDGEAEWIDTLRILRFYPAAGFEGLSRVQYLACDDNGTCDLGYVSIYSYDATDTIRIDTIGLVAVNTQSVTAPLPWSGFVFDRMPDNGEVSLDTLDWTVTYKAAPEFAGLDTFSVTDDAGFHRTIIVDVLSVPEENGFVIDDVFYPAPELTTILNVYQNDYYNLLQLHSFTQPDQGFVFLNGLGKFFYVPPSGFTGHTSFTYTVCNGAICETADVDLFVGKQAPRKDISYVFDMPIQDIQRLISLNNSMEFYTMRVVEPPQHGQAFISPFFYDFCSPGFTFLRDELIYRREGAYTGLDTFSISYCVQNITECDTVDIVMNIYDGDNPFCCNTDCVWPGDANADGYVDMSDLLQLGMHVGSNGVTRSSQYAQSWHGQRVSDWKVAMDGLDAKFADTDGDGVITSEDTSAIAAHYYQTNNLVADRAHLLETIPLDLGHDNEPRDSGDLVMMDVVLGNYFNPALDIYGLSFTIDYPIEHVDTTTRLLDFPDHTWLVEGSPKLSMNIEKVEGHLDGGVTRLDKIAASGYGLVASFSFIIIDDIDGIRDTRGYVDVPIILRNVVGSRADGTRFSLPDVTTYVRLNRNPQSTSAESNDLYVFPNPASDQVTVHLNGQNALLEYRLFDMQGLLVQQGNLSGKRDNIILENVQAYGMHALVIQTSNGPITKKVLINQE